MAAPFESDESNITNTSNTSSAHRKTQGKLRGPYKRYLFDTSASIPKTTKWNKKVKNDKIRDVGVGDVVSNSTNSVILIDDAGLTVNNQDTEFMMDCGGDHVNSDVLHVPDSVIEESDEEIETGESQRDDDVFSGNEVEEPFDFEEMKQSCDHEDERNQPLFNGSRITLGVSLLLIMTFVIRHGISANALTDLLALIEIHCLLPNCCPRTLRAFRNFFKKSKDPVMMHYYCSFCGAYCGKTQVKKCKLCECEKISHFLQIPIEDQLRNILTDNICQVLKRYKSTFSKDSGIITDILDGKLYKEMFSENDLREKDENRTDLRISLQINTDGVSLFKSSNCSVWPIYGVINELPPKLRFAKQNRLFIGLWYGKEKPIMGLFMKPFVEEVKKLFHKGIEIKSQVVSRIYATVLGVVCDAPARCMVQNFVQFNGKYGCSSCLSAGENLLLERGQVHIYPYDLDNQNTGHADLRSHIETEKSAKKAEITQSIVNGVKGYTPLYELPLFDMIRQVTVDYMHCVLLGVMKKMINLWTNATFKKESWYIGQYIKLINSRILRIKPPNIITRLPHAIDDLANWKASQYRSFLLFYSLPCLVGVLKNNYLLHYLNLVNAIYILLQKSITVDELQTAESRLNKFCIKYSMLYGSRHENYNVHCLLHLVEKVKDLGPLWSHSTFFFEDLNRDFRTLFHGTQNVQMQIMHAVCVQQSIPSLIKCLPCGSVEESIYLTMSNPHTKSHRSHILISNSIYMVGKQDNITLDTEHTYLLNKFLGDFSSTCKFYRLQVGSVMFHCKEYTQVHCRNSFTVKIDEGKNSSYGQIKFFLKVLNGESCDVYVAVIEKFELMHRTNILPSHMSEVSRKTSPFIVPVSALSELCVFLPGTESDYIAHFPNTFERD